MHGIEKYKSWVDTYALREKMIRKGALNIYEDNSFLDG